MIETKPWPGEPRVAWYLKASGFAGIAVGYGVAQLQGWPWWGAALSVLFHLFTIGCWWFGNAEGLDPGYRPAWPLWKQRFFWFWRNFAYNFFRYVVGVEDRPLVVIGTAPLFVTFKFEEAPPATGWKWSIIRTGWVALPFVSFTGSKVYGAELKRVVWYVGWLPSGGRLGAKWNLAKPA